MIIWLLTHIPAIEEAEEHRIYIYIYKKEDAKYNIYYFYTIHCHMYVIDRNFPIKVTLHQYMVYSWYHFSLLTLLCMPRTLFISIKIQHFNAIVLTPNIYTLNIKYICVFKLLL